MYGLCMAELRIRNLLRLIKLFVLLQDYTPFPPPQQPRKIDLEMESGEYFLSASQKRSNSEKQKAERQKEVLEAKKRKREDPYQPPKACLLALIVLSPTYTEKGRRG